MYLKLSRECVVHSVICVLFIHIVIAVKDVMPRRPRISNGKADKEVSFFVLRNIPIINCRLRIIGKRA